MFKNELSFQSKISIFHKTDHHDVTEILLKVALNIINLNLHNLV